MSASVPERPNFEIGAHYVRKELHDQFRGNRQKGISAPADEDFVFIFTGPSGEEYGYDDELLDDGMLIYFGEGRVGDMEFTDNNGNTKIRDHGCDLYVFKKTPDDRIKLHHSFLELSDKELLDADLPVPDGPRSRAGPVWFPLAIGLRTWTSRLPRRLGAAPPVS